MAVAVSSGIMRPPSVSAMRCLEGVPVEIVRGVRRQGSDERRRYARRFRLAVRPAHARDPLPAPGDEDLAARVELDVVEGELDLRRRELRQAHAQRDLVERGQLGEELALDLQRE